MAKADRLEAFDLRRVELEAEYKTALIAALRQTASGTWGLFDHLEDRSARAKIAPVIETLDDLAQEIDRLRSRLDLAPFALHAEFTASRGRAAAHAVGEPKQAQAWLERLEG